MTSIQSRILFTLTGIIPTLFLLIWFSNHDYGLVDDAYIPMTYARNIVNGDGIVFYPGGERVEGFTSPLWLAWLTSLTFLHLPLPLSVFFSSLVMGMALVFFTVRFYRKAFYNFESCESLPSYFWPFAAGMAVVCDISVFAYAVAGMETCAYSLLLLLLLSSLLLQWKDFITCSLLLAVSLIRPEGIVFAAFVLFSWKINHRFSRSSIVWFITWIIIPYLLFIAFRFFYFDQLFPNTFYAKHNFRGWELICRGLEYVYYFFRPRPLFLFALFALLLEKPPYRCVNIWIFLCAFLHITLVILEGGDHFTLNRFMVPAVAFFSVLSVRGIDLCFHRLLLDKLENKNRVRQRAIQGFLGIAVLILLLAHGMQISEFSADTHCHFAQGARYHHSVVQWTRSWAKVGQWLQEKYPPETRIAVINAGAIPYYSGLSCIDMLGLNDSVIAHTPVQYKTLCLPGHDHSNPSYVLQQNPQLIQLFPLLFFTSQPYPENKLEDMITYPAQIDLWQDQRFHELYQYKTEETRFGFISYFERRDHVNG